MREIKLPKLRENVGTVEVNEVLVSADQEVAEDQPLLVVNADKANMEVKSPVAGKVVQVRVKVGDELKVGDVYCVIEANGAGGGEKARPAGKEKETTQAIKKGEKAEEPRAREVKKVQQEARPTPRPAGRPAGEDGVQTGEDLIPASPGTRWLARKLGVDLRSVRGSGRHGRITEEDVKSAFAGGRAAPGGPALEAPPLPDFEEFGEVERKPLTRVRKLTTQTMALAW